MAQHETDAETVRRRASETLEREDPANPEENRAPDERERGDDPGGGPWAKTSSGNADRVSE
jgi:hypothetical protein